MAEEDEPNDEDPGPLTCAQAPVPVVGVFPAKVAVSPQTDWSVPAFAVVGVPFTIMLIWSVELVQGGFEMVH